MTATVTFEPTTPENEAGDAGHDAGLTEGSAIQTNPVAALAWGIARGIASAISSTMELTEKSFLDSFKEFLKKNTIGGEIRVSQAILRFPVHSQASPVPLKSPTYPTLLGDFFRTAAEF